jgi:hypothetical protein
MKTWLRWTLLVLTIGGGYTGFVLIAGVMLRSNDAGVVDIIVGIEAVVLYTFIVVSGLLFADNPKCTLPMIFAFGLQIPWLSSPILTYSFSAGLRISAGLIGWRITLGYRLGSDAMLLFLVHRPWGIGINFFALLVFILLLRYRKALKKSPELPATAAGSPAPQSMPQPGGGPTPGTLD